MGLNMLEEKCPECNGDVRIEHVSDSRAWVCVDCGEVLNGDNLKLEEQESTSPQGKYEVEEI